MIRVEVWPISSHTQSVSSMPAEGRVRCSKHGTFRVYLPVFGHLKLRQAQLAIDLTFIFHSFILSYHI